MSILVRRSIDLPTPIVHKAVNHILPQLVPAIVSKLDNMMYVDKLDDHWPDTCLFIALVDDVPVGIGTFLYTFRIEGPHGYIEYLVVDENHRNEGIGKALLQRIHQHADDLGCKCVELISEDYRKEAHLVYRNTGYTSGSDPYLHFTRETDPIYKVETDR